jgi:hypothetical protein
MPENESGAVWLYVIGDAVENTMRTTPDVAAIAV